MKFTRKITFSFKEFSRRRADRKLVREMRRAMPDMMAEMDRMVDNLRNSDQSIMNVIQEAEKLTRILVPQDLSLRPKDSEPPASPLIDPADCIVLQNPITVSRQPIRVRSGA